MFESLSSLAKFGKNLQTWSVQMTDYHRHCRLVVAIQPQPLKGRNRGFSAPQPLKMNVPSKQNRPTTHRTHLNRFHLILNIHRLSSCIKLAKITASTV
jgi:hypothetical protein